ncbi:hypothetical protein NC797_07260 [Aquibacillus sp. 3ASR75-11]|uniref:Uncharacterized protein n=1 Tax=Terrihalobacillus insolitus TaxID=2950438 RepID=A0A9X3WUM2_9BACI|nr:hypothetical protein [Terrihalobacillus insolitus]MDC3424306.1 hypothetical protein [Terrihalobacillus insolitus]
MNETLSTFMKIAITAIVIGALIFGALYGKMGDISNDISNYIESNS